MSDAAAVVRPRAPTLLGRCGLGPPVTCFWLHSGASGPGAAVREPRLAAGDPASQAVNVGLSGQFMPTELTGHVTLRWRYSTLKRSYSKNKKRSYQVWIWKKSFFNSMNPKKKKRRRTGDPAALWGRGPEPWAPGLGAPGAPGAPGKGHQGGAPVTSGQALGATPTESDSGEEPVWE